MQSKRFNKGLPTRGRQCLTTSRRGLAKSHTTNHCTHLVKASAMNEGPSNRQHLLHYKDYSLVLEMIFNCNLCDRELVFAGLCASKRFRTFVIECMDMHTVSALTMEHFSNLLGRETHHVDTQSLGGVEHGISYDWEAKNNACGFKTMSYSKFFIGKPTETIYVDAIHEGFHRTATFNPRDNISVFVCNVITTFDTANNTGDFDTKRLAACTCVEQPMPNTTTTTRVFCKNCADYFATKQLGPVRHIELTVVERTRTSSSVHFPYNFSYENGVLKTRQIITVRYHGRNITENAIISYDKIPARHLAVIKPFIY